MPLSRRPLPFDDPEWVFELKYDGFRSLAVIEHGRCQLISRNGHQFASFSALAESLGLLGLLPARRHGIAHGIVGLKQRYSAEGTFDTAGRKTRTRVPVPSALSISMCPS